MTDSAWGCQNGLHSPASEIIPRAIPSGSVFRRTFVLIIVVFEPGVIESSLHLTNARSGSITVRSLSSVPEMTVIALRHEGDVLDTNTAGLVQTKARA